MGLQRWVQYAVIESANVETRAMDLRAHRSERRRSARFDRSRRDPSEHGVSRMAHSAAAADGMAGLRHSPVFLHGHYCFVSRDVV